MNAQPRPDAPRVVILNDASIARGGATGLALLSARLLAQKGFRVTFICGDTGDDGVLSQEGIELISLGGVPLLSRGKVGAFRSGLYDKAARDRIAGIIRQIDAPDTVYHLHGWAQILSPSVFDALAPVAARTFVHAHDFFLACPNGSFFDFQAGELCHRTPMGLACLSRNCDRRSYTQKLWRAGRHRHVIRGALNRRWAGILQLHPGMTDRLQRGGVDPASLITVRNPVERLTETRIRAEENAGLVFVGRTEVGKGLGLLCDAARQAGLSLKVIGSIGARSDLVSAYPEVDFRGWVSRQDLPAALADARVLVMPSRFPEPFGLVTAEASLAGLPVAISGNAMLAQDVADAGLGAIADVTDAGTLARDLTALATRPDTEIKAISEAGFAGGSGLAQTPDAWADQLAGLYTQALTNA